MNLHCLPFYSFCYQFQAKYLEKVLFIMGEIPDEGKDKIEMLEHASYLTLDQYGGRGADDLDYLKNRGVKNLPNAIDDIDFQGSSFHRRYTHKGWNYSYLEEGNKANWQVRKDILRSTTNKVFSFGLTKEIAGSYCAQCDSFSALIYYVHILGDQIHDSMPKGFNEQLPFARVHADENTPDIFYELRPHIEILFNPNETEFEEIEPLTVDDFCRLIDYNQHNRARLKENLAQITFSFEEHEERFCSITGQQRNLGSEYIRINPHVIYHGHDAPSVQRVGRFCA